MLTIPQPKTPNMEWIRFFRFLAVGALGTLLDFGLLTSLKIAGLPTLLANSAGFLAGLTSNYSLNSHWTFNGQGRKGWQQFFQFSCVSLAGLGLNNLIVLSLEDPLGLWIGKPDHGYLPAKIVATGLVVFWNYFANRCWTFKANSGRQI